jgi:hypothetical protein
VRIFVPDEEGELLGDRAVVICSEVEDNDGAGVTEAAEELHAGVTAAFRLADPVWIEHHGPAVTDGSTESFELVVFSAVGKPSWKPLERFAVETLVGRPV